jgi:hypothetical protein
MGSGSNKFCLVLGTCAQPDIDLPCLVDNERTRKKENLNEK